MHDALTKAGRETKSLERWEKTLEAKEKDIIAKEASITATQDKIVALEADLQELAKDDPDRQKILQKIKSLEEMEARMKSGLESLEAQKAEWGERVKQAEETNLEIALCTLPDEYEGGKTETLRVLAGKLNLTTEEQLRAACDSLWVKKPASPAQTPAVALVEGKPDSGRTTGGTNTDEDIRAAYRKNPNDLKARADYLAYRRRRGLS